MQMAEGRDKGNNHPLSSAVDAYLSFYRPNRTTKETYMVLSLPVFKQQRCKNFERLKCLEDASGWVGFQLWW